MDKYIGRLLDNRYEILEVIGTGGMAVVYKARCHRLNRLVAIKILKDDYLEDEEFRRRFHAESQAVAMLGHPNIVAVYDVSTSIMADYIVMELIEGITLKQYMEKKGVLNWKETLHFAIQIAKALEHAHSRGIVHRDIKPHNIMVLKNGSVKVADFGIARMMSKGNTLTKEALGSVHYISPEQAKGGRVDSRSDIYSLGVVMYEMMSGRPPYDAESPVSVAIQHINGGAAMPSTLNPNIPGGLEQIIMKAMALNIDDRYVSATAMLADMDEFRKDPAMLFEYHIGPVDDVTRLTKPAVVRENPVPVTTAEKVVRRAEEGRRKPSGSGSDASRKTAPSRRSDTPPSRRKRKDEEKNSNIATVAIVICSLVMVVALVVLLILLLGDGGVGKRQELSEVPQLIGKEYSSLGKTYGDFQIRLGKSVYDDTVAEGVVISHEPAAGERVAKGVEIYVTVSKGPAPETKPDPVQMKDVVGLKQEEAESILRNLSVGILLSFQEEASDTIPAGCVVRTKPSKDQNVADGQTIQIWISTGSSVRTAAMPNVKNEKKDSAAKILSSQGLKLNLVYEEIYHKSIQEGFVVETDPVPGVEISTGDTVTLYISKGQEMQNMPNVVGMDIGTAVKILVDAGFTAPNIEYVASEKTKDTVVSQSHEKNTMIEISTQITLEISEGPKPTEPPETTEPPQKTRDILIDLKGTTEHGECTVEVLLNGQVIYNEVVEKDTAAVIVPGQTGEGKVTYTVRVKDLEGWAQWNHVENFDDDE